MRRNFFFLVYISLLNLLASPISVKMIFNDRVFLSVFFLGVLFFYFFILPLIATGRVDYEARLSVSLVWSFFLSFQLSPCRHHSVDTLTLTTNRHCPIANIANFFIFFFLSHLDHLVIYNTKRPYVW